MCLGSHTVTHGCVTVGSTGSQNFDFLSLNLELAQSRFTLGGYMCFGGGGEGLCLVGFVFFSRENTAGKYKSCNKETKQKSNLIHMQE